MASMPLASFRPTTGIRASAIPEDAAAAGMRNGASRKPFSAAGSNWWTPIFGFGAGGPDYITGSPSSSTSSSQDNRRPSGAADEDGTARGGGTARAAASSSVAGAKMPPAPVVFTDEKARMLRMKTAEASSFHDVMYHSAIASRMASEFQGRGAGGRSTAAR